MFHHRTHKGSSGECFTLLALTAVAALHSWPRSGDEAVTCFRSKKGDDDRLGPEIRAHLSRRCVVLHPQRTVLQDLDDPRVPIRAHHTEQPPLTPRGAVGFGPPLQESSWVQRPFVPEDLLHHEVDPFDLQGPTPTAPVVVQDGKVVVHLLPRPALDPEGSEDLLRGQRVGTLVLPVPPE